MITVIAHRLARILVSLLWTVTIRWLRRGISMHWYHCQCVNFYSRKISSRRAYYEVEGETIAVDNPCS